jgi:hypothetical protein
MNIFYEHSYKILNLVLGYHLILKPEQRTDILDSFIFGLSNKTWSNSINKETIQIIHRVCLCSLTMAFVSFGIDVCLCLFLFVKKSKTKQTKI